MTKRKEYYHTTNDGREIKLSDLQEGHLDNIIRWIERKAQEGVYVRSGSGWDPDSFWMDEELYKGEQALRYLKYDMYLQEKSKRQNERDRQASKKKD